MVFGPAARNQAGAAFVVACAALLAGCAAPVPPPVYVPIAEAQSYGYADRQLGETSYEVSYVTAERRVSSNSIGREAELDALATQAQEVAQLRAADIAIETEHPAFKVIDRRTDAEVTVRDHRYYGHGHFHPFGFASSHHLHHHPVAFAPIISRVAFAQVRTTLTVELLQTTDDDSADAAVVRNRLQEKYLATPSDMTGPAQGE
ncbi:MAG: hypothetical protein QNJ94_11710 [Alphaproteobacteria bacterium]|nr:hypothetical protein [Alphaproteobacteria bacterium]